MTDVSETKSALFFGSRAMKITNTAYINVEVRDSGEVSYHSEVQLVYHISIIKAVKVIHVVMSFNLLIFFCNNKPFFF